jgi:hypothetical protein
MNPWAVRTFEDLLEPVIAGLSDYTRNFYRHDDLNEGGERDKIVNPRVIVMVGPEPKDINLLHDPTCEAIREWIEDNREGLEVPQDLINDGCEQVVFGMWTPNPQEKGSVVVNNLYWRHVFFAILQNMEVT